MAYLTVDACCATGTAVIKSPVLEFPLETIWNELGVEDVANLIARDYIEMKKTR
jgi:hypothetical protein